MQFRVQLAVIFLCVFLAVSIAADDVIPSGPDGGNTILSLPVDIPSDQPPADLPSDQTIPLDSPVQPTSTDQPLVSEQPTDQLTDPSSSPKPIEEQAQAASGGGPELANQQGKGNFDPNLKQDDSFSTSMFSGAFIYDYSFKVPPGTNGLQPNVKLNYNNQRASTKPTLAGNGWELSQSFITRDAKFTPVTSDDSFILTIDGSEYELAFSPEDQKYRTKIETFLSIDLVNTTGNEKGQYWRVRTKDGTAYVFGSTAISEQVSTAGAYVYRWWLDSVTDLHNNSIFYNYSENPNSEDYGVTYPTSIRYNNDRQREILFFYTTTPRQDGRTLFNLANNYKMSRALKEVQIRANGALTRKYLLEYSRMELTPSLFLENITEYGSDGITALQPVKFYYNPGLHWEGASGFIPSMRITNNGDDQGVRYYDMNGDGRADIAQGNQYYYDFHWYYVRASSLSNGNGFVGGGWQPPDYFVMNNNGAIDWGTRTFDINGDGFSDFVTGRITYDYFGNPRYELFSSNNPFTAGLASPGNNPPAAFVDKYVDRGVRVFDMNGDGLPDISVAKRYNNFGPVYDVAAYINTGSSFYSSGNFQSPVPYIDYYPPYNDLEDTGARITDVNGDGLMDLVVSKDRANGNNGGIDRIRNVYLNTGNGWAGMPNAFPYPAVAKLTTTDSLLSTGLEFGDVNGDGLEDLIVHRYYYNRADFHFYDDNFISYNYGYGYATQGNAAPCYTAIYGFDMGCRFADVNGDGGADVMTNAYIDKYDNSNEMKVTQVGASVTKGGAPYQLREIRGKFGSKISINYTTSTSLNNTDANGTNRLPFNIWVVSSITADNGLSNAHNYTIKNSYNYSGGMYNFPEKEFRGFAVSNETKSDGSLISHYFHQDSGRKGMEYKTETYDASRNPYSKTEYNWSSVKNGTYYIAQLSSERTYQYDGIPSSPAITSISYAYDPYGNIHSKSHSGDESISGDEKYENYEYAYDIPGWVISSPKYYSLKTDPSSPITRETKYYYDDLEYGSISKGDLSKQESTLSGGSSPISTYSYDSYGNLISQTDPLQHTIQFVYGTRDPTFTFPEQSINALGHTTNYTYDLGTGNLLSTMDANGFTTSYEYDAFGRLTKEIQPYDSSFYPTKLYQYEFDGIAPEKVELSLREQPGSPPSTYDTYSFYDGLGNLIQQKSEAENSQQIISDSFYDGQDRLMRKSNPYFASSSDTYSSPNASIPSSLVQYDPLSRIIKTTNPDGTFKSINYSKWNITTTDENGNKRMNILDAYGQITSVYEYNAASPFITNYNYDAAGSLIQITDNENNLFLFTYDSLGRKTSMNDPDMGIWNYSYDAAGNLITQTDARGNSTIMQYDALNRLTHKSASPLAFTYFYDEQLKGTLSKVLSSTAATAYSYDSRYRKTSELKSIQNNVSRTNYTYDSLDRITSTILPNSETIYFTYSTQNQLSSIPGIINSITCNEFNKPTSRTYANSLTTQLSYNPQTSRLTHISTSYLQNLSYSYDSVGNILQITDAINSIAQSMRYDPLDRLISASRSDNSPNSANYLYNYTYSSIGNILKVMLNSGSSNSTYSYSPSHKHAVSNIFEATVINASNATFSKPTLISFSSSKIPSRKLKTASFDSRPPKERTQTTTIGDNPEPTPTPVPPAFEYDSNGNMVSDRNYTYEYNSFNQLSKIRNKTTSAAIAEYLYDDSGSRIRKTDYLKNETILYINDNFLRVMNATGTFDTTYFFANGQMVARKDADGSRFYYHPDHLGSTTLVTNQTGAAVENTNYEPFGKPLYDAKSRFLYTGKELDSESHLMYYGARYYNPEIMRFVQPDAFIADFYNPQSLNRYSYVQNNPYKYTDESGHFLNLGAAVVAAGVGAVIGGGFELATQLWTSGGDLSKLNTNAIIENAAIGAVTGAVAGVTMGGSLIAMGAAKGVGVGIGKTAVAGMVSGAVAGQAGQVTTNAIEGKELTSNLLDADSVAKDAAFGAIFAGVGFKSTEKYLNTKGSPSYSERAINHIEKGHTFSSLGSKDKFVQGLDFKELGKQTMANGAMSLQLRPVTNSIGYQTRLAFTYNTGTVIGTNGQTTSRLVVSSWYQDVITQFCHR